MTAFIPTRRQALTTLGLLGLLLLAIYGSSLSNEFVDWDDRLLIVENPIVHSLTPATVKQAFTTYDPELYIPLTLVGYQFNHLIAGLSPFIYHFENLLFHLLNAALVVWFILLLTGNRWIAAVTGLLFAVHPLHTEAVAWASSRKDVQATCFFLLTLITYLLYSRTGDRKMYRYSVGALLLALLSKVIAITAPFILLLLDWREGRKIDKANLKEKLPFFVVSILFGLVALGGKHGNDEMVIEKLFVGSKAIVFYMTKLVMPTGFSVLYPFTESISISNTNLLLPVLFIFFLCIVAWYSRLRTREIMFAWLFFLITLIPTFSNFAKGKDVMRDIYFASDRYAYIPSIGILFLIALLLHRMSAKRAQLIQTALALVVVLFAFQAHAQSLTWQNTESLFTNVLKHYPNSHIAHNNLGSIQFNRKEYRSAYQHYRDSLAIRPNGMAYYNLGQFFTEMNQMPQAMDAYRSAIEQRPNDLRTLANLGALEVINGEYESAIQHLLQAYSMDASLPTVHYNLGVAYERLGNVEQALVSYRAVLRIDPNDTEVQEIVERLSK
jgi:tetratricopeptide (TPR) repeat protein